MCLGLHRFKWGQALSIGLSILLSSCSACRRVEYNALFREHIAPAALECFHPSGEFQEAGAVEVTGSGSFKGSIFWSGGFLGNNYVTNVEVRMSEHLVTVYLLEDTAIVPALNRNCQLPFRR